jgi:catechol 2,3-dioxygenase-like lactoylglutathione lyase family enzyme
VTGSDGFDGVLETALCYDAEHRSAMHRFFGDVLGLRRVAGWDAGTAYRLGDGVLLIFDRERLAESDSPVSRHGTTGVGHICLRAAGERYEGIRAHLKSQGVEIVHDHEWPGGGRSFYFHDPAGNLLEVADRDIWPG